MSVDRRLHTAARELRELDIAVPPRVPRRSLRSAAAMPVVVLLAAAVAIGASVGLGRGPAPDVVESAATPDGAATVAGGAPSASTRLDAASFDISDELAIIARIRLDALGQGTDTGSTGTATSGSGSSGVERSDTVGRADSSFDAARERMAIRSITAASVRHRGTVARDPVGPV